MKKKVIWCLIGIFIFLFTGVGLSLYYITETTDELTQIIKLHEVEQLRRSLIISVQTVQTNLYTANTPHATDLDSIVSNVENLDRVSSACTSCHHSPRLYNRIINTQSLIKDYETHLSFYLTGRANSERMMNLKDNAVKIGKRILANSEDMSHIATKSLADLTEFRKKKNKNIKSILIFTLLICFLLGVLVAIILIKSVTNPVNKLLDATRKIASGALGTTVEYKGKNEFGELASHFNEMSMTIHDEVIERKKTEESLRKSEERYALAARGANDGLWDWDLATDKIHFSSRWKTMLGFKDGDISDNIDEWFSRIFPSDREIVKSELNAHIEGLTPQFQNEQRVLHSDGSYRWMLTRGLVVRDESGKAYRMAGSQTDISERKVVAEQLLHDAFHDALTSLPNRSLFMDRLSHAIKRSARNDNQDLFAVLFIDLDRFKVVNDSLGHLVGDKLLIEVSRKLLESLRPGDTVARLGGDEFAILLEDVKSTDNVTPLISRIGRDISAPFNIDSNEIFITVSIGVSFSNVTYEQPEDLLRNADIAMYHAKNSGRDRHEIFSPMMYDSVVASMQLETDLRRAMDSMEFQLFYQPIVSISTRKIIGFEALIRWLHNVKGIITPDEFIPVAEETGLIIPIGEWVLGEACSQIVKWHKEFPSEKPFTISVNVSGKQFTSELIQQVKATLSKTCLEPSLLILEITETVLMEHPESISPLLSDLKRLGVQLHIDDFGTGYSSLSYLHDFPIDALKIDKSFVSKLSTKGEKHEIVKTITELANNLNMAVTVEGVETSEQLEKILSLNCKHMQGYLFSRPLDRNAINILLKNPGKTFFS